MQPLVPRAASILRKCIQGIKRPSEYRRIDEGSGYLPVSVECIGQHGQLTTYSLAHYGEQNGDLMRDPEMTFFVNSDGVAFPASYRNDYLGIEQVAIVIDGEHFLIRRRLQQELCQFAKDWLANISEQQGIQGDQWDGLID